MTDRRFTVLGLGAARAGWFADVARWATVGSIPVEFIKCISAEELRARLGSDRFHSAMVVDGAGSGVDRDLIGIAEQRQVPVLVVAPTDRAESWVAIGASTVLPPGFDRAALVAALEAHARPLVDHHDGGGGAAPPPRSEAGRLVAVTGPGGTGCSTVAIALAQGLAPSGPTLLADLRLRGEMAMLHDAHELVPGLPELVGAHRRGCPGPAEVERLTFDVPRRGYRLLLGLRRARDWAELRPMAVDASVRTLRETYTHTVVDVDPDLEGEAQGGSVDVEERHALARSALAQAALVLVVGHPGLKGIHALVRVLAELQDHGVSGPRVLAVVNRSPRSPRARAELNRAITALTTATGEPAHAVVHIGTRRGIDDALRDGVRLPAAVVQPLSRAAAMTLGDRAPSSSGAGHQLEPVAPGSLGHWEHAEAIG